MPPKDVIRRFEAFSNKMNSVISKINGKTHQEVSDALCARYRGVRVKRVPVGEGALVIIDNNWNEPVIHDAEFRQLHSIVAKEGEEGRLNVIMYSFDTVFDDIRDAMTLERFALPRQPTQAPPAPATFKVWEGFEGPNVSVYHDGAEWRFSTTRCIDMHDSVYRGLSQASNAPKSHGQLFSEVVGDMDAFRDALTVGRTYNFTLVHVDNRYLVDYSERFARPIEAGNGRGFLVHTITRDQTTHERVVERVDLPYVVVPEECTFDGANALDDVRTHLAEVDGRVTGTDRSVSHESVLVECNGRILKVHNGKYRALAQVLPNYQTQMENFIATYRRMTLDRYIALTGADPLATHLNGSRVHVKGIINHVLTNVISLLYGMYTRFTTYDPIANKYTKINSDLYEKHIAARPALAYQLANLQELTRKFKVKLDRAAVARHVMNERHVGMDDLMAIIGAMNAMIVEDPASLSAFGIPPREIYKHDLALVRNLSQHPTREAQQQ